MPREGVVHALRNLHSALIPGGVLVDTQPVSTKPRVATADGRLGTLDMREWVNRIRAVDERVAEVISQGFFAIEQEKLFVVTDSFDHGAECLATVVKWGGTRVAPDLARRLEATQAAVTVEQVYVCASLGPRSRLPEPWRLCRLQHREEPTRRLSLGLDEHLEVHEIDAPPFRRADHEAQFAAVSQARRL